MFEDRFELRPAHRLAQIFPVHQVADGDAEPDIGEIHQDQRQHEIGNGDAEQAEEGEPVVTPAVFVRGGIDADWKSEDPGDDDGDEGHQNRQPQAVSNHIADRQLIFEGITEITDEHAGRPAEIADRCRLIEAIADAQLLDFGKVRRFAHGTQLCDVAFEIIARR
ncbi:hypothetical protein D3C86_1570220 [compost metagenome]